MTNSKNNDNLWISMKFNMSETNSFFVATAAESRFGYPLRLNKSDCFEKRMNTNPKKLRWISPSMSDEKVVQLNRTIHPITIVKNI